VLLIGVPVYSLQVLLLSKAEPRFPSMTSPRHFAYFLALGLFWGVSPSLYQHLSRIGMPVSHTICITGLGVGLLMAVISAVQSDTWRISPAVQRYGAICAFLMNVPFAINLYMARHVPPTELSIVIATSPFFNFMLALATGWDRATPRRLLAMLAGFTSTAVLILSREGMLAGQFSWWLVASFSVPILYCGYNTYAGRAWPAGADTMKVGAAESMWSGIFMVPVIMFVAPFGAEGSPALLSYWILGAAVIMWVVERIAYFTLIRDKGAVYTVQATYVATPAAVVIAAVIFGGTQDVWLWISLALLMVALYLNNTGRGLTQSATQPSS
jgi:drug/metabolite transporter (DMT)-like permease